MKLIKLTPDHYVVVDDSEIKKGDWIYNAEREPSILECVGKGSLRGWQKITHSTQPIEPVVVDVTPVGSPIEDYVYGQVQPLDPSEVKALIGEVTMEEKALEMFPIELDEDDFDLNETVRVIWIDGYSQALEDNKGKKYTEEDMKECVKSILRDLNAHNENDKPVNFVWTDSFKKHIQSLQPKTEWGVEFDGDGKLKLI